MQYLLLFCSSCGYCVMLLILVFALPRGRESDLVQSLVYFAVVVSVVVSGFNFALRRSVISCTVYLVYFVEVLPLVYLSTNSCN